jgi:hypothetical protein
MPRIRSVIVGPSNREDPLVTFVPSLVRQVLQFISIYPSPNFVRSLNTLFIDHDTEIPPYFRDNHLLTHLAFIMHPQLGDNALEKIARDYLEFEENGMEVEVDPVIEDTEMPADDAVEEENNEELEVLDEAPVVFKTPGKKKKTLKVKEKLDDSFLRHSKRLSEKMQGYKNEESARKAKAASEDKNDADQAMNITKPMPLAFIPPGSSDAAAAPYLSSDILRGIAKGFLQIPPESVLAALLKKDNLDG